MKNKKSKKKALRGQGLNQREVSSQMIIITRVSTLNTQDNREIEEMDRLISEYASNHRVPMIASSEFRSGFIFGVTGEI